MSQTCSTCKINKPLGEFYKNKAHNIGYDNICKLCSKIRKREYNSKPEVKKHRNELKRLWREKNHEQNKAQSRKDKKNAYKLRKEYLNNYKISKGGCERCGYNKCLDALDFHHLDESTKLFNIRDPKARTMALSKLIEELNKCIVVCSNCHREIHYEERNSRKT